MEQSEELRAAKEIIQTLMKAKKNVRMYPENNPIYVKTIDDSHEHFSNFLEYRDDFKLRIRQNSILHEAEEIYSSTEKDDNLALFFFKDGLRELTFKKGLTREELEEFLKIIAREYDRNEMDDDIITLLWERDFQHIHYIVDEAILVDVDEEDYGVTAEKNLREHATDLDDLKRAYTDGFQQDEPLNVSVVPLSEADLHVLLKEMEKDASSKIDKLVTILFEMVYLSEKQSDVDETFQFIRDAIQYSMRNGDIDMVNWIMRNAREVVKELSLQESGKNYIGMLSQYLGHQEITGYLVEILDRSVDISEEAFTEYVGYLEKNAIQPLMNYLGEMKTVRARKHIIDALTMLGKKDIQAIARGLEDQRWYLVRNIIYILRKIGDRRATEFLLRSVRHGDIRVRKEAIKALGEMGGKDAIQTVRECLDDADGEVRVAAAKAFGAIGTEVAKRILLEKISNKMFRDRDFNEKKTFYEVLVRWKDQMVFDFLIATLRKKSFFGRAKNEESRACAAFALGLLGRKDALTELYSARDSSNDFLRDFVHAAIRKLEHDQ